MVQGFQRTLEGKCGHGHSRRVEIISKTQEGKCQETAESREGEWEGPRKEGRERRGRQEGKESEWGKTKGRVTGNAACTRVVCTGCEVSICDRLIQQALRSAAGLIAWGCQSSL